MLYLLGDVGLVRGQIQAVASASLLAQVVVFGREPGMKSGLEIRAGSQGLRIEHGQLGISVTISVVGISLAVLSEYSDSELVVVGY